MAGETTITVIGNLTADPELRFTPSGQAVANFTVASTSRVFDRTANEWKDGGALFLRCAIWREAAENVAESLTRGARVVVSGRLKQRTFETRDGDRRTVVELEVDEIGPLLRYATAKVSKVKPTTARSHFDQTADHSTADRATSDSQDGDPWRGEESWPVNTAFTHADEDAQPPF
ncbi:single-stranded DNA-binding protein [Nocardia farcinica]|uniref:single-stranded DNA-binding protein n=1 Tax=Nocardia farcinica TaxID=37329 RepID=UPI00311DDD71